MPDNHRRILSVIMPVFNEEKSVAGVIEHVLANPLVHELIVVDDGSCDRTHDILKTITHDRLKIRLHDANAGKGAAIRTGIPEVTGEIVIIQDADLEYNPDEYIDVLKPILNGQADVVYGSRYIRKKEQRVHPFWHTLGNNALTLLSNILTNLKLTDMETCYKCFKTDVIRSITIQENRFGVEPEITAKIARMQGIRIFEVAISYEGRWYDDGKKIGWKDGLSAIRAILEYNIFHTVKSRPLRLLIAVAILLGLMVLLTKTVEYAAKVHTTSASKTFLNPGAGIPTQVLMDHLPSTGIVSFATDLTGDAATAEYYRIQNRLAPLIVRAPGVYHPPGELDTYVIMRFTDQDQNQRFMEKHHLNIKAVCPNRYIVAKKS